MIANTTIASVKKGSAGQLTGLLMALYLILVLLGILGNSMVILVVGNSIIREPGGGRNSDMILVNMALTNLLVSLLRNTLLVTSDFGLEVQNKCFWVGGLGVLTVSSDVHSTIHGVSMLWGLLVVSRI